MKFFSTLFFLSFFAMAYCAAVGKVESSFEMAKRDVALSNAIYVPTTLPNGKKSITLYTGDVLEGTIVEGDNGEVVVYDAAGNVVDLGNVDEMEKRQLSTILRIFATFISRYGQRAWNFLYCISFSVALRCTDAILRCATQGVAPWNCLSGIFCAGVSFRTCAGV